MKHLKCKNNHHRVITSTRGTDIDFLFRQNIPFLTIHLHKWNKISVTYFEYRYTLPMYLYILDKSACFDSCVRLGLPVSVGCVTTPRRQSGDFAGFGILVSLGLNNAATSRILVNPAYFLFFKQLQIFIILCCYKFNFE